MKIAGRKNDGAWFRNNVKIKALAAGNEEAGVGALLAAFQGMSTIAGYVSAINQLEAVLNQPDNVTTNSLATTYSSVGIPRQSWFGVWSYDTYTKQNNDAGNVVYVPDHQAIAREFGKELRKTCTKFFMALRQVEDLRNEITAGNPGGIADATKGT